MIWILQLQVPAGQSFSGVWHLCLLQHGTQGATTQLGGAPESLGLCPSLSDCFLHPLLSPMSQHMEGLLQGWLASEPNLVPHRGLEMPWPQQQTEVCACLVKGAAAPAPSSSSASQMPACLPIPLAHLNPRRMFPRPSPQKHDAPQAAHLHRKLTASAWPPTCLSWPAPQTDPACLVSMD